MGIQGLAYKVKCLDCKSICIVENGRKLRIRKIRRTRTGC